ncbi:MAG: phytanoyl-CoA dioxygenase family protein [Planctomycetota bacterium]|nr:phytanoyl-CoA dioxygenase family protein [Planctomycetota bacterium]
MHAVAPIQITKAQQEQYREEGYFILESVIPEEHLRLLRDCCQASIERVNAKMDAQGVVKLGINLRDNRYFCGFPSNDDPQLREFYFSPLMAEICKATIGGTAYYFWEQYVVKAAEKGMTFSWHQDSGYCRDVPGHPPYVTCWCALDDMSEANGTAYILPYGRAGSRELKEHVHDPRTNDLIGYHGEDPGVPVLAPAGSIAVFSSFTFHRSGFNRTNGWRRVYLAQYSPIPMASPEGKLMGRAEPFLKDGELVAKA